MYISGCLHRIDENSRLLLKDIQLVENYARVRNDLILSRQESPEGYILVAKDPASGRFFRFREIEGFVLERLDGATGVESLCKLVEEKYDSVLPQEHLEQFIEKLRREGLIEDLRQIHSSQQASRVQGSAFYLRIRLFDPDKLFDRLTPWFRPFFTRTFMMLSLCSIFAAGLISLTNSEALGTEIASLFRFQSIILAWITVLVIIAFHEFAHGITCKQYGGKVQEIGFLLIYFQPAFYCNVSDAWLLPKKSERLWITFAGAYFELFLCAISVFVWRITDTHTVVNYCALVVMATSGIKTFFNLNPLIKLDGYYLLSDYLEIPNLRSNSFRYLGNRIRALIGARLNPLGNLSSREKRIYLAYSILSGAYSYWLFALVLTYVAGLLTQKFQGWGFVLFLSLLIAIFRHPLSRLMHVNASAPAANPSRRIPASLKIAGIFIIFVAFSYFFTTNLKIGGEFVILPIHNADVRAEVAGIIENIYQDEGDVVEQGAVIAQLSTREYQADLEKIKAQIDEKSAKLKLLKAGARQEELSLARTQIAKAEERLKYAQKDLEMDRALLKNNVISVRQFDQSEGNVAILEKELEESKSHLDILLAGNRKEEIDATQAEMNSLEAQKKFLEQQLQSLRITSPIAGVISTHKLREKIGQNVNKGDLIAEVHAVNTMEAEIAIPEKEIADVTVDQRVVLKARSYPQEDFEGKVIAIAPTVTKRENTFDERTILVITRLDNASLLLKPDMSGNAKIYCGERRLIEIIARRIVRFVRVEFWSWW